VVEERTETKMASEESVSQSATRPHGRRVRVGPSNFCWRFQFGSRREALGWSYELRRRHLAIN
jgi:hypothetical protein